MGGCPLQQRLVHHPSQGGGAGRVSGGLHPPPLHGAKGGKPIHPWEGGHPEDER